MNTSHYPSLELCKKLRDIGFPHTHSMIPDYSYGASIVTAIPTDWESTHTCPCPSVMEMLDVIPHEIHIKEPKHTRWLHIGKDTVSYMETAGTKYPNGFMFMDSVLPNAIAEMILWLHENEYLIFQNGN